MTDPIHTKIATHREACAIRDMACTAFDNAPEDEECAATQFARDHMHDAVDVEKGLLADLMSTTPTSVAGMAALILHVDAVNRQQRDFGNDDEGRAEILIARLSASIGLMKVA
jgi:hypothetical protein